MGKDARIAALVGAATADQREEDPSVAVEAIALMVRAARAALDDSGQGAALAQRLDWIGVPEGTWTYRDPGRLVAQRLGREEADAVTTVMAGVGILQQDLLTAACSAVMGGEARVAIVVGGEAKYRDLSATKAGGVAEQTQQGDAECPDFMIRPSSLGVSDLEITHNTVTPVAAYALIENAIGHALGRSVDEHRDAVARLWAGFAAVAASNPKAWDAKGYNAAQIRDAGADNRMISFPYTKRHSAQWNVDQAAAVVFCSLETARELAIDSDRFVFPHATVVANDAVAVSERREVHRCIGAEIGARRVLELAGVTVDDLRHVDLYGCFPAAVELLGGSLGLRADGDAGDLGAGGIRDDVDASALTLTGGLTFAGGPLNNYVLQALVELVERLRRDPGSLGLSTSVSGFLAKQGFSIWSSDPPVRPRMLDVSDEVARAQPTVAVVDGTGRGTVVTWTVDFAGGSPSRAVALIELADGRRTIATSTEVTVAEQLMGQDPIGGPVTVDAGGVLRV